MKKLIIIISFAATCWLLTSCQKHKEGDGHSHGEEAGHSEESHDEHENDNTAMLTAEQMKSIKIELNGIEKKQLTASLKVNGLLKVPNQNKANATALLGGVIKSILVQTGNTVRKGQVLATITNNSFITMQEEFISVSAKTDLAQLENNRQKELLQGNAGALKNLQTTETELKILRSRKASLQKQLELIGINSVSLSSENIQSVVNISSPISGTISTVLINIGSYVDASNPIAEIVDNNQLHLDLYVYEKDLQKLKVGQTIHFTLTNNPGKEYDAEVYAISNTFEQNTKAVAVHAMVKGLSLIHIFNGIVQKVEGATAPSVERVAGLPQIVINYNRAQIANYGLNIEDINHIVSTAFAGGEAGVVFENERKFDLVVRLDSTHRNNIEDVSHLYIPTANGIQIPLSQVADIKMELGPAQISREDGKRRIVAVSYTHLDVYKRQHLFK